MKVALITSIFGNFDKRLEIPDQSHPYDLFFFSEATSIIRDELHPRLKAKYYKFAPHLLPELQKYDAYLWLDGNIQITSPLWVEYMVKQLQGHEVAAVVHNQRDCVYDEMDYMLNPPAFPERIKPYLEQRYGHESKQILKLYQIYWDQQMPQHWGLFSCGLFARINNDVVNSTMEKILLDCFAFCSNDQLPFSFYLWKYELLVNRLKMNIVFNEYWQLKNHG